MEEVKPAIRNEQGQYLPGVSGNPSGRPRDTMKDYLRRKMINMTDEEKEKFLRGVPAEIQIRLAEGNPANNTDITSAGKPIVLPSDIIKQNES
jgi:hypothetical protein